MSYQELRMKLVTVVRLHYIVLHCTTIHGGAKVPCCSYRNNIMKQYCYDEFGIDRSIVNSIRMIATIQKCKYAKID